MEKKQKKKSVKKSVKITCLKDNLVSFTKDEILHDEVIISDIIEEFEAIDAMCLHLPSINEVDTENSSLIDEDSSVVTDKLFNRPPLSRLQCNESEFGGLSPLSETTTPANVFQHKHFANENLCSKNTVCGRSIEVHLESETIAAIYKLLKSQITADSITDGAYLLLKVPLLPDPESLKIECTLQTNNKHTNGVSYEKVSNGVDHPVLQSHIHDSTLTKKALASLHCELDENGHIANDCYAETSLSDILTDLEHYRSNSEPHVWPSYTPLPSIGSRYSGRFSGSFRVSPAVMIDVGCNTDSVVDGADSYDNVVESDSDSSDTETSYTDCTPKETAANLRSSCNDATNTCASTSSSTNNSECQNVIESNGNTCDNANNGRSYDSNSGVIFDEVVVLPSITVTSSIPNSRQQQFDSLLKTTCNEETISKLQSEIAIYKTMVNDVDFSIYSNYVHSTDKHMRDSVETLLAAKKAAAAALLASKTSTTNEGCKAPLSDEDVQYLLQELIDTKVKLANISDQFYAQKLTSHKLRDRMTVYKKDKAQLQRQLITMSSKQNSNDFLTRLRAMTST